MNDDQPPGTEEMLARVRGMSAEEYDEYVRHHPRRIYPSRKIGNWRRVGDGANAAFYIRDKGTGVWRRAVALTDPETGKPVLVPLPSKSERRRLKRQAKQRGHR